MVTVSLSRVAASLFSRSSYIVLTITGIILHLSSIAQADSNLLVDLHKIITRAEQVKLDTCNESLLSNSRCQLFRDDLVAGREVAIVNPIAIAANNVSAKIYSSLFVKCDLSLDKNPFRTLYEGGFVAIPQGPFEFYDAYLGNGQKGDAIVEASSFWDPGILDGTRYSWRAYYFVKRNSPCMPETYAFLRYGDLRPMTRPHNDSIVLWRGEPFVLAVWEVTDRLTTATLYSLGKPELGTKSLALQVFIFIK